MRELRTLRSDEMLNQINQYDPRVILPFTSVMERVAPLYHMIENANELRAQPMMIFGSHWYFFKKLVAGNEQRLQKESIISKATIATVRSLERSRFAWLDNVPIDALVYLRSNNENEVFRNEISKYTSALHEASLDDLDLVAAEASRAIASLLGEHDKKARAIDSEFRPKFQKTALKGWLGLGATILPALAPISSIAGLGAAAWTAIEYASAKFEEREKRRSAAGSLTGILASAKRDSG